MTIEFDCPHCGKLLRTTDDKAGMGANCPGCGTPIQVPYAEMSSFEAGGGEFDIGEETAEPNWSDSAATSPPTSDEDMKPCPMCGEQIRAAAVKCRYCGETFGEVPSPQPAGYVKPHRGAMILTFGILSIVLGGCAVIFGPLAWVLANQDLKEMEAGVMDPSGEGVTKAGKICGIIGLCFFGALILFYCLIFMAAGMAGALN